MIIRSSSRKTNDFRQLLLYMFTEPNSKRDDPAPELVITHNIFGESINEWVAEFEANEQLRVNRRKNNVIVSHDILSWQGEDTEALTLSKIEDLTRKYIQTKNPNGLYVAVLHTNTQHPHVHICGSGVEYMSGKSMRLSRKAFKAVKLELETYQQEQYPELTYSRVDHHSPQVKNQHKTYWPKKRGQIPVKEQLKATLQELKQNSFHQEDFLAKLISHNLTPYYRQQKLTGIQVNGKKYRFKTLGINLSVSKNPELTL